MSIKPDVIQVLLPASSMELIKEAPQVKLI